MLLGPVSEGADPADAKLTVLVDGEEVATADDVTEATGDLDGLVKHVAKTLKAAGAELERGDMVICGSIVPALDIAPGTTVEVRLPPLGSLVVSSSAEPLVDRRGVGGHHALGHLALEHVQPRAGVLRARQRQELLGHEAFAHAERRPSAPRQASRNTKRSRVHPRSGRASSGSTV